MPPPPSNPSQRVLIIGAIIAMCVIAGSSYASYQFGYGRGAEANTLTQTQGITTIPEVRIVIGTVEKISGQEVTLKDFQKISSTVSSTDQSARVIVVVGPATSIERLIQKSAAVMNKEQAAFAESIKQLQAQGTQGTTADVTPPDPFTREKITTSDIKVGDAITAYAGEDVSKVTRFTATRIDVRDASITAWPFLKAQ